MPKACAVPKCKTGYRSVKEKCSVFRVPKNVEQYKKWLAVFPGGALKQSQYVCEKHFEEKHIIRLWQKRDADGRVIAQSPYQYPKLDEFAVPTIFNDSKVKQESAASVVDVGTLKFPKVPDVSVGGLAPMDGIDISGSIFYNAQHHIKLENILKSESVIERNVTSPPEVIQRVPVPPQKLMQEETILSKEFVKIKVPPPTDVNNTLRSLLDCAAVKLASLVPERYLNIETTIYDPRSKCPITLPKSWGFEESFTKKGQRIIFSHSVMRQENGVEVPVMGKSVTVDTDKALRYSVLGRAVNPDGCELPRILEDTTLLPKILNKFINMKVCIGLGPVNIHYLSADSVFKDCIDQWRQNDCILVSKKKRCDQCIKMRQRVLMREKRSKGDRPPERVRQASNPIDQRKLLALRKRCSRERRLKNRAKLRGELLRKSLKEKAEEIASIHAETLEERCLNLKVPAAQRTVLAEIVSAASKKGSNNQRYTEEWIMLCILMNIRSPGYYEFLRKNNVLPLPCKKTIRSYFSLINTKFGFDEQFGKLLQKQLDTKSSLQRHGVLLLDEINFGKSVNVCTKNLTYSGLTDFGDDGSQSTDIKEQATHGLVLIFQSLADEYTQPIAVFATKNPLKGEQLSKLVVKAILFLENNGAIIDGVIGAGVSSSDKMWSLLGVSGAMEDTKTWFTHPFDEDRKVFAFSDTPHVVKCIRNRLYNKKKLRMKSSDDYISWEYFRVLFDLDSKRAGNARACPKITQRHVVLDHTSKMCVRLATQIFGDSVAQGLAFYLSEKCQALAGCEKTIEFCSWINAMIGALNRESPNQGLTLETHDFKVLQESLQSLNDWESALKKGDITADEFLTPETARNLRISLQSTMGLCKYLIRKFNFQYLLTGRVNQDKLEKFSGTIRQTAGCKNHPNSPTFLQLYKILTMYNIIKPPKFGNSTVSEESSPQLLVSLHDLQDIYGQKCEPKAAKGRREMQREMDEIIEHNDWEADETIQYNSEYDLNYNLEHDYALSPTLDCIIYYVTGFFILTFTVP